ncbi:hypothetical protein BK708_40325 [Bacillus thuringiensis serovar yunnanensis]|nr:hypothetical protein BK708_40325 [Bacillus thuringiensis serovar yunnanensis]
MSLNIHFKPFPSTLRPPVSFDLPAGSVITDYLLFKQDDPTKAIGLRLSIIEAELGSTIRFKRLRPNGEIWFDSVTINKLPYWLDTDYCRTLELRVSASGPLKGEYSVGANNVCP